ncbi:MAG: hypothetical protein IJT79_05915 [Ruminococcus sp.]|nr:hypothetical protein [Ruminococcus sp.]
MKKIIIGCLCLIIVSLSLCSCNIFRIFDEKYNLITSHSWFTIGMDYDYENDEPSATPYLNTLVFLDDGNGNTGRMSAEDFAKGKRTVNGDSITGTLTWECREDNLSITLMDNDSDYDYEQETKSFRYVQLDDNVITNKCFNIDESRKIEMEDGEYYVSENFFIYKFSGTMMAYYSPDFMEKWQGKKLKEYTNQ